MTLLACGGNENPGPAGTPTPVSIGRAEPTEVPTDTPVPAATDTPVPTDTPTPVPTATHTPIPTATHTPVPTATNTPAPTATNTPVPTATNTPKPTNTPTPTPIVMVWELEGTTLAISGETEIIDAKAFKDSEKFAVVIIKDGVKEIREEAFAGCKSLAMITIPESVTKIAKNAIPKTVVIYGDKGTYAETYAKENSMIFVSETVVEDEPAEIPVVKMSGEDGLFAGETVKAAVLATVEKLREDGLIAEDFVCLTMDKERLIFDITPGNTTNDMVLSVDADGVYTLAMDYDFWFMEGFGPLVNGIDPAPYNKEMLLNFLGLISEKPAELYNTIDMVYFSSYGLSGTGYLAVGDCYMMDGLDSVPGAWSFKIKK